MTKQKLFKVLLAAVVCIVMAFGCMAVVGCVAEDPETTEYTVTFNYNDGATANLEVQTVDGKVAEPTAPTRDSYIFDGWYTAAEGGEKYDFNTVLTADTTLYAHWTEEPPVVTNPVINVGNVNEFVSLDDVLANELVTQVDLTANEEVTVDVADGVSGRYTVAVAPVEVVEYIFNDSQVEIPCENLVITVTVGNSEIKLSWENVWGVVEDESAQADFTGVKSITVSAPADVSVVMLLWQDVSEPEPEEIDVIVHVGEASEVIKVVKGEKLTINQILEVVNKDGGEYTAENIKVYTSADKSTEYNFDEEVQNSLELYVEVLTEDDDPTPPDEEESTPLTGKIYVVGDSTVCDYRPKLDDYYLPRYGYGTMLYNYLNCNEDQIVNLALSGRSSLSFLTEANYNTLKNSIGEGDYLIIGFGHNDEKSDDAARFTHPGPDYKTATTADGKPSFQYTLYENYIKLAVEKGATPILCTPIVRYNATGEYDNKSVSHVTGDGDYAAAIIKLGADTNTAVVDLTGITKDYYKANNDTAKYFHAYTTYNESGSDKIPDGIDTTHINMYGAKMIAYWLVTNLPAGCPLKAHVQNDIAAPTYEVDFPAAIKSDYTKPDYSGFNPANHASNKVGTIGDGEWYHTAMGVLGGASKVADYTFTNSDGTYTIKAGDGSKFAATQDGFGAIFTQIDITKNFTISAKVKVTGQPSSVNDQNAFGIMLRDDVYIDSNIGTIVSNFVSASVTGKGSANMSRTSKTALDYDGTVSYAQNVEYEITLTRVGQVVTATVTQGSNSKTTTFTDISYVGIDNNYMYLCLFANRSLTVEFSNVTFEITGEAQGA